MANVDRISPRRHRGAGPGPKAVQFYSGAGRVRKDSRVALGQRIRFQPDHRLDRQQRQVLHARGAKYGYLELFEYKQPQSTADPASLGANDYGIRHLCFQVEDVAQALTRVIELGGGKMNEPVTNELGITCVYCRDPFGNLLELIRPAGGFPSIKKCLIRIWGRISNPSPRCAEVVTMTVRNLIIVIFTGFNNRLRRWRAACQKRRSRNRNAAECPAYPGRRHGFYRHRRLRGRDTDPQPGCPGGGRDAFFPVVYLVPVFTHPGNAADRERQPPGGTGRHGGIHLREPGRPAGLRGLHQSGRYLHGRTHARRGLFDLHDRQVAPGPGG